MRVKIIDEAHEEDLTNSINEFISNVEVIDIKFNVAVGVYSQEQIYCFTAMIIYK